MSVIKNKSMFTAYLGNFVDFLEFGLFSALLPFISNEIFKGIDPSLKSNLSYFILYVGFLGRPIGGYFFGSIGDKIGVHRLLFLSILGISISSLLIGLMPGFTYSWLLLALLRFSQGIFTGAEQASATVLVVKKKDKEATSYTASALLVSFGVLGVTAAQFVAYLMSLYPNSIFSNWRYAFILVSLVGFIVFCIRIFTFDGNYSSKNTETKDDTTKQKRKLSEFKKEIIIFIFLCSTANSIFYLINSYINSNAMIVSSNIIQTKFLTNLFATSLFSIFIVGWGIFLDKIKPNIFIMLFVALMGLSCLLKPLFDTLSVQSSLSYSLSIQASTVLFCQLLTVIILNIIPKYFPESICIKSTGFIVSIGSSVVGGSMPLLASLLNSKDSSQNYLIYIIFILISLGMFGVKFLHSKNNDSMNNEGHPNIRV